ncbi:unnamed protein product, partial [Ascophyllum nodosum]
MGAGGELTVRLCEIFTKPLTFMNNAMAWPLQQNHRGFDEDLPRTILPSASAGAYPTLFGSTGTPYYNSRSLANAGANCRTSQQMLT